MRQSLVLFAVASERNYSEMSLLHGGVGAV